MNTDLAQKLYLPAVHGRIQELVKALAELPEGVDINGRLTVGLGFAPLYGAALRGQVATVEYLIMAGADINISDNTYTTPITWILRQTYLPADTAWLPESVLHYENLKKVAKLLLRHKADIHLRNFSGVSALSFKDTHHDPEIRELLQKSYQSYQSSLKQNSEGVKP